ncbi:Rhamnogalacturonan endolyase [Forsythia ovata]|uniref:Rhamnogalacturonan endolyase n=1 Tax=Forsythia ovata TaxID=205694 RepID=A0ABD1UX63_9LAMI
MGFYLQKKLNFLCHQMFVSTHYDGEDLVIKFGKGERWKKVFGPIFVYLNSVSAKEDSVYSGTMLKSRYISKENILGKGAYVGVASPGENGSFQTENKLITKIFQELKLGARIPKHMVLLHLRNLRPIE